MLPIKRRKWCCLEKLVLFREDATAIVTMLTSLVPHPHLPQTCHSSTATPTTNVRHAQEARSTNKRHRMRDTPLIDNVIGLNASF